MWYFFKRKRSADPPIREIRRPVKSEFQTLVTKTGLGVTFKPTKSTYTFVTDNVERPGSVSFIGVQHASRNTQEYNSDEVEALARQVASDHASIHFSHLFD